MYTTATAYRPQIRSPFQPVKQMPKKAFNVKEVNKPVHPVQEEISKCIGEHHLVAVVEEDTQTLDAISREGLIAFIATLSIGGRIVSQGRGSSLLGQNNRFISKAVGYAFNACLADSVLRAKLMDSLRGTPSKMEIEDAFQEMDREQSAPASEKQRSYLASLINDRIADEDEREQRLAQICELSRKEAGIAIETLLR
ncbi:MAG: hypothetical protein Q7S47_02395 [bacterium]|nr:hypothetical protein [bacterium]